MTVGIIVEEYRRLKLAPDDKNKSFNGAPEGAPLQNSPELGS